MEIRDEGAGTPGTGGDDIGFCGMPGFALPRSCSIVRIEDRKLGAIGLAGTLDGFGGAKGTVIGGFGI